jgi:hypothetical protein
MARKLAQRLGFFRMARIRIALNRLTRGRVGMYSTAEHYSSGPTAKVIRFKQFDGEKRLTCPSCGWQGRGDDADMNFFSECADVSCPTCEKMLLVLS